ncbi:hypothetical protein DPEC_G00256170 [Dallia pectoralis]|uniref:Uncharacterized protein n=1 Tax=Dallia pectoralis TaxID=75939 RepID=A0ACC2FUP2_DALPE|nr:hypothetical protein DPEC_G00256170 [Dallia pectoralis]
MDNIAKVITSGKVTGLASAIGATVITNKDKILDLAKFIGVPEETLKNTEQLIRMGNSIYIRDMAGGLKTLVELTGWPLGKGDEYLIERDFEDGEIDYATLLALVKS